MALVDELTLEARAGHGGHGVVRWLHEKGKEYSGPSGGNGGDGGDVYIMAVRDINLLARYRGDKKFEGGAGADGENQNMHGKRGQDLVINLPLGSLVRNTDTGEVYELLIDGQKKMVLRGGRGGAGNAAFKSSVNRSPEEFTPGGKGEAAEFIIELRLIADAGLVGLPNAGKTSLLNALTNAGAKVGSYAFTTLDPNLGVFYGYVMADIPGLIEGASAGKGLGFKFLRHIARTRLIVHCVSLESEHPLDDYHTVRKELESFEDDVLAKKPEIIVLTKSDTADAAETKKIIKLFGKDKKILTVTVLDDEAVKKLGDVLVDEVQEGQTI
jgi:GTP-binding protein